jgi:hypothetical protein
VNLLERFWPATSICPFGICGEWFLLFSATSFDYGPVLLLMPFGFHLAMDTLPSEVQQAVALGRSWPNPAFAFVPV